MSKKLGGSKSPIQGTSVSRNTIISQENRAVQALKSDEFSEMPDSEALDVALQLQVLLRGQEALLSRIDQQSQDNVALADELTRLKQHYGQIAQSEQRWKDDRAKMMEEWRTMAEKAQADLTSEDKARYQVRAAQDLQTGIQYAKANNAMQSAKLKQVVKDAPTVEITRPGIPISTPEGVKVMAEEVRLADMLWVFQPNVPQRVPEPVAVLLQQRDGETEVLGNLKEALSAENMNSWDDIKGQLNNGVL